MWCTSKFYHAVFQKIHSETQVLQQTPWEFPSHDSNGATNCAHATKFHVTTIRFESYHECNLLIADSFVFVVEESVCPIAFRVNARLRFLCKKKWKGFVSIRSIGHFILKRRSRHNNLDNNLVYLRTYSRSPHSTIDEIYLSHIGSC